MKKTLFILILLSAVGAYSQNVNRTGFYHIIKRTQFPDVLYTSPDPHDPTKTIKTKMHFCDETIKGIVTLDKGVLYFDLWSITGNTIAPADGEACVTSTIVLKDSKLSLDINRERLSDPTYVYAVPFRARGFGLAALPLRLRFERNDQPTNLSTQLSFAFNYNWMRGKTWFTHRSTTNYSWGYGPFLGLSIADIKKASSKDLTKYTADRTNPAITFGGNLVFNRNNLGLVVASGIDISMGTDSGNWLYQGIPWLGIGVIANLGYF
jgi:hypothetical protein